MWRVGHSCFWRTSRLFYFSFFDFFLSKTSHTRERCVSLVSLSRLGPRDFILPPPACSRRPLTSSPRRAHHVSRKSATLCGCSLQTYARTSRETRAGVRGVAENLSVKTVLESNAATPSNLRESVSQMSRVYLRCTCPTSSRGPAPRAQEPDRDVVACAVGRDG